MSISSEILLESSLVITRVEGVVDDNNVFKAESLLSTMDGFNSSFNQLADSRLVSKNLLTPDGLLKTSYVTPFSPSSRRAYVVNDELASMFATLFGVTVSETSNYLVTFEIEEACEWLGVAYKSVLATSIYNDSAK